jgi:preprotein translocase subunit SecG
LNLRPQSTRSRADTFSRKLIPDMFTFLLIIQTIVAAALVTVILMQRSEGGGLGVGGNSSGLMSARGAADFLTRATAVLATLFIVLSIALAALAAVDRAPATIDPTLQRQAPAQPAPGGVPLATGAPAASGDPLAGVAEQAGNVAVPAQPATNQAVPLAQ